MRSKKRGKLIISDWNELSVASFGYRRYREVKVVR